MLAAFGLLFIVALVGVALYNWVTSSKPAAPQEEILGQMVKLQFEAVKQNAERVMSQKAQITSLLPKPEAEAGLEALRAGLISLQSQLTMQTDYGISSDSLVMTPKQSAILATESFIGSISRELNKAALHDSLRQKRQVQLHDQALLMERLCQMNDIQTFAEVRLAENRMARKADSTAFAKLEVVVTKFERMLEVNPMLSGTSRETLKANFSLYQELLYSTYATTGLPWWQNAVFLNEIQHQLSSLDFKLKVAVQASNPSPFVSLFRHNYASIMVLAFTVLSSLGISIYYSRELTIPVRRLAQQVENMVNSNFQRIQKEPIPSRIAELQRLNESVFLMASTIQENLEMIGRKNEDLANLYHETLDNINTARSIQHSLMPPLSEVQRALPESFVLNRPKDIVSGDFYWIDNNTDVLKIAVADCTGHGVAGAFMSFVGHSLLTRISDETPIFFDAASILDRLNDGVRSTLRQADDGSFTQNGMDISLVCIDFFRGVLHFAGANQTLYLIRNGELNTIKSNKFSIGGPQHKANVTFTNHKVAIMPGDVVYLSSDGFADQIGGPTGDEKFKTSRLRTLFQNVHNLRMEEQGKVLSKVLEQWLGPNQLLDDVLIVGFRIPER